MDKKNKIVLIICIIIIVVSLGAAVSIAIISNKKEKIDIDVKHTQVIKQQENDKHPCRLMERGCKEVDHEMHGRRSLK